MTERKEEIGLKTSQTRKISENDNNGINITPETSIKDIFIKWNCISWKTKDGKKLLDLLLNEGCFTVENLTHLTMNDLEELNVKRIHSKILLRNIENLNIISNLFDNILPLPTIVPINMKYEYKEEDKSKCDIVYLTMSPLVYRYYSYDKYTELESLDIKKERKLLFDTFKESHKQVRVLHKAGTSSNMIEAVCNGCKCIHFTGYSLPNRGELLYEDSKRIGEGRTLMSDLMRRVCVDEDVTLELAFVRTLHCEKVGQSLISSGVKSVIAIEGKLMNKTVSVFTKQFYKSLLDGLTVAKSYNIAKNAVESINGDTKKFLLFPENKSHNVKLFGHLSHGKLKDLTPISPPNNLNKINNTNSHLFMGRNIEMRNIMAKLINIDNNRLLVITGEEGTGKSCTTVEVCKYLNDRRYFSDGIFYCDVNILSKKYNVLDNILLESFKQSQNKELRNLNTIQELYTKVLSNMDKLLIVFDGLDNYLLQQNEKRVEILIKSFLEKLLLCVHELDTKIIIISSNNKKYIYKNLKNCSVKYFKLKGINPKWTSQLLNKLCNNQWKSDEIVKNKQLMQLLKGNPKLIYEIAKLKKVYKITDINKLITTHQKICNN